MGSSIARPYVPVPFSRFRITCGGLIVGGIGDRKAVRGANGAGGLTYGRRRMGRGESRRRREGKLAGEQRHDAPSDPWFHAGILKPLDGIPSDGWDSNDLPWGDFFIDGTVRGLSDQADGW